MPVTSSSILAGAAMAALFAAGAASADEPVIATHAFTLGSVPFNPFVDISLVSDTAGSATFSLGGLQLGSSADSAGMADASADMPWENFYDITVRDGYRITAMTLTGSFRGSLQPADGAAPDAAQNSISLRFGAYQPGQLPVSSSVASATDLQGERIFTAGLGRVALGGEFYLGFLGSASTYAESALVTDASTGVDTWLGSRAMIGADHLVLTVDVAPVPEPQGWAMLLGGLALAGAVARRRSK